MSAGYLIILENPRQQGPHRLPGGVMAPAGSPHAMARAVCSLRDPALDWERDWLARILEAAPACGVVAFGQFVTRDVAGQLVPAESFDGCTCQATALHWVRGQWPGCRWGRGRGAGEAWAFAFAEGRVVAVVAGIGDEGRLGDRLAVA